VLRALSSGAGAAVLPPEPGKDNLGDRVSLAFLRGDYPETFAYQLVLSGTETLRRHLELDASTVEFRRGIVDLVQVTVVSGRRKLRLIDIKSTPQAFAFHKTQVAWYAWMLRAVLEEHGIDADVDEQAEIWHLPRQSAASGLPWVASGFSLRSYESVVQDFARRELRAAARKKVGANYDDTAFHIYYKCEQCRFLKHCGRSIRNELAPAACDISAIPGLTQQSKAFLGRKGIRTVGQFLGARVSLSSGDVPDWLLATRGPDLVQRARAIESGTVGRLPGRSTLRMPPFADVKVVLAADPDPMASRLAALGVIVEEDGAETERRVVLVRSLEEEGRALRDVLGAVGAVLARVDEANRFAAGARKKLLHIYTYEPAEAKDLAEALGRHLSDGDLLAKVLDLVRMFPPEGLLPEPEYRGYHHLPACAVRSVLEDVFVLPVKVSYDLTRVSQALRTHLPAPEAPYSPHPGFRRPFSARLPLSVCRDLEEGRADTSAVNSDVAARLEATLGIVRWLERIDHAAAPAERFLRLRKGPFFLHGSVPPLGARALELLRAQATLENRVGLMASLTELAQPLERRRVRQRSIVGMRLLSSGERRNGGRWMLFQAPADAADTDIQPSTPRLLLSDGHADHVLDMTMWPSLEVALAPRREGDRPDRLLLTMSRAAFESPAFQGLWARDPSSAVWVLDKAHFDVTTARLETYLRFLDSGAES
jgi:hypothetical protein